MTGKNVTRTVKVFKKDESLLETRGYHYILCYEIQVASLFNMFLVVRKSYLDCILAEPEESCKRRLNAVPTILSLIQAYQKGFIYYFLPSSLKILIFINVFASLYGKANSKEIC